MIHCREFEFISRIAKKFQTSQNPHVIRAIGDDAAVIRSAGRDAFVFTTDSLAEDVHFTFPFDSPYAIGWKSLVASLSDVAAMNASPVAAVVAVAFPKKTKKSVILKMYDGIAGASKEYDCPIVGGDTTSSKGGIFISVSMLGKGSQSRMTYRSGSKPGDLVCVTGDLGRCHAALMLSAKTQKTFRGALARDILYKHNHPAPRFDVLRALRRARIHPTAMIDISDGLSSELHHLANNSAVGINAIGIHIDAPRIPLHPSTIAFANRRRENPVGWALQSGEEYELLFTIEPMHARAISRIGDVTVIGTITEEKGVWMTHDSDSKRSRLVAAGYVHF